MSVVDLQVFWKHCGEKENCELLLRYDWNTVEICVKHHSINQQNWKQLPFPKQALVFTCLQCKSFENTVGKGEIARYEGFSACLKNFLLHSSNLKLLSAKYFNLEGFKIFCLGKG